MKIAIVLSLSVFLYSCSNVEKEQSLEEINKKSAREVTLLTQKSGDSVLHITKQIIWNNGNKIVEKNDTIITANKINSWGNDDSALQLSQIPIYVTVQ